MSFNNFLRKIATGTNDPYTFKINKKVSNKSVGITATLERLTVRHHGTNITISRNQDNDAEIEPLFAKTSRPCPPFCVQAMTIATGVETIGELEFIDYLIKSQNDNTIIVIDSRIKNWVDKGTIPSSKHIPWTSIITIQNDFESNDALFEQLGIRIINDQNNKPSLDFSHAKTLVLFCNGTWCGQTSESIKALLAIDYPAEKLKYYRDGMQGWVSLGLTTVTENDISGKQEPICKQQRFN